MLHQTSSLSYGARNGSGSGASTNVKQVGFVDDFLQTPASSVTAAALWQADTAWVAIQVAGGTQTPSQQNGVSTFTNPGQTRFVTSAVSGQGVVIYKGNNTNGNGTLGPLGSSAPWEFNIIFSLAATTTICVRAGAVLAGQAVADAPTAWFGVEYDTANVGNTDTKFTYVTRTGGSPSYSTTGAVNVDTSFHRFRIRSAVAGTILFSTDGGAETAISSTVSTGNMSPFFQLITRTTGAATANLDYFSYAAVNTRV